MKRDFRQQRGNNWTEQRRRDGDQWATPNLENADFEEYYKLQARGSDAWSGYFPPRNITVPSLDCILIQRALLVVYVWHHCLQPINMPPYPSKVIKTANSANECNGTISAASMSHCWPCILRNSHFLR